MKQAAIALSLVAVLAGMAQGSSFPIAEPRIGLPPGYRWNVHAAASDEQFLLVWHDDRATHGPRAYAARMSRTGAVLDPVGLPLDEPVYGFDRFILSAASDGRDFLVAVQKSNVLQFIKVTRDGAVQKAPAPGFPVRGWGQLVWLGDAYAFFFNAPQGDHALMGGGRVAIIDRDGRVLIEPQVLIESAHLILHLTLAASPAGAVLVWTDGVDVYAEPVDVRSIRNATLRRRAAPPPVHAARNTSRLVAASSPSRHFLAWTEGSNLIGRVLDAHGAPVGPRFVINGAVADTPDVVWNGSRFVVIYNAFVEGDRRLFVAEYDEGGALLSTPLRQKVNAADPQGAAVNGDTVVAWVPADIDGSREESVRADILSGSRFLFPANGILVSQSLPYAFEPEAVWRGDHYLAVWNESGPYSRGVAGRFDAQGRPLDGPGRVLDGGDLPRLASDGRGALVVWTDRTGTLHVAHIAHGGAFTERTIPTNDHGTAGVTWTGEEYALCTGGTMATVSRDGAILKTARAEVESYNCEIVWTGSQYVRFWSVTEFCFPFCRPPGRIFAQAYSRNLNPVGSPVEIAGPDVITGSLHNFRVAVAGDRTLVVWRTWNGVLRGARILRSGVVLDPRDGFEIGPAARLTEVFAEGEDWIVGSGPYAWRVSANGVVQPRVVRYPFVPLLAQAITVRGGPAPLVIHQTQPGGSEQVARLVGRYVIPKQRTVRR